MEELNRQVAGDWFELKERLHAPIAARDFMAAQNPNPINWGEIAAYLQQSFENGVVEFKQARLADIASAVEEAQFSDQPFSRLSELELEAAQIVLVAIVQRALGAGEIKAVAETVVEEAQPDAEGDGEDTGIQRIVEHVQEMIAEDESLRMRPEVKQILLQLQKYRQEMANLKKMREQTSPERLPAVTENFRASFARIFESIQRHYRQLLEHQAEQGRQGPETATAMLLSSEYRHILYEQMEVFSRIRTTLRYVRGMQRGMRDPIVHLQAVITSAKEQLTREFHEAAEIAGTETAAAELLRRAAREVAAVIAGW